MKSPGRWLYVTSAIASLAFAGLTWDAHAAPSSADSVQSAVQVERARKDSFFAASPDSPIPPAARSGFTGLRYYPYDPAYRVRVSLHAYALRLLIRIPLSGSSTMEMERYGLVTGTLDGKSFRLLVYRAPGTQDLQIFFTDPTNGAQTYGGGRYVQLEKQPQGGYVLDFNTAYNPYCAYNHEFVCPLPPPQNHLDVPVRAGEMAYGADLAKSSPH